MNLLRSLWSSPAGAGGVSPAAASAASSAENQKGGAGTKKASLATSSPPPSSPSKSSHRHHRRPIGKVVARSSSSPPSSSSSPSPIPDDQLHPLLESRARALRTPHSGYHFDGSPRRFFEGWYFKVTLPGEAQAFALIYSVEDPGSVCSSSTSSSSLPRKRNDGVGRSGGKPGVGVQVMGPGDSYLIHYDGDVSKFWATDPELALGACFEAKEGKEKGQEKGKSGGPVPAPEFDDAVELGFQATSTWHQGSIVAREEGASGSLRSTVGGARWAFRVEPVVGWGGGEGEQKESGDGEEGEDDPLDHVDEDDHEIPERPPPPPPPPPLSSSSAPSSSSSSSAAANRQKATAGWLAALPVFEPHWQVLMAKGKATGWIEWGDKKYEFVDAPAYAEKNWGGSFPSKWWWVQCDALEVVGRQGGEGKKENNPDGNADGSETSAVTAVGAIRSLPGSTVLPWLAKEDVGMIGLHYDGAFYEFVPWKGSVSWDVAPWGSWRCRASSAADDGLEVELEATCAGRGTPLRAPTESRGLAVLCRDSFAGKLRIRLYRKKNKKSEERELVAELASDRAAVETGGGPWGETWSASAAMKQPFRSLVRAPIDPERLSGLLPSRWRPKGL